MHLTYNFADSFHYAAIFFKLVLVALRHAFAANWLSARVSGSLGTRFRGSQRPVARRKCVAHYGSMASRSLEDACNLSSVGIDELKELCKPSGDDIICTDTSRILRLRWEGRLSPFSLPFSPKGVTRYARVLDVHPPGDLPPGQVRVHFCAERPCNVCFSGKTAPKPWAHLVTLCCVAPDVVRSLADFYGAGPQALALPSSPALATEVLATEAPSCASTGAASSVAPALAAPDPSASNSSAIALAGRNLETRIRDMATEWRPDGICVGLFALLVWAVETQREIHLWLREDNFVEVVKTWAPWAKDGGYIDIDGGAAKEWQVVEILACIIEAVPGTTNRTIRMATSEHDVLRVNHYMPLVANPLGKSTLAHAQHPPCDGTLCGCRGNPCLAEVVRQTMRFGKIPINVVSNGNCAFDTFLYLRGQRRGTVQRRGMRLAICREMCSKASDPLWQNAFHQLEGEGVPPVAAPEKSKAAATDENRQQPMQDAGSVSEGVDATGADPSLALAAEQATLQAAVCAFLPKDIRQKKPRFSDFELERIVHGLSDKSKAVLQSAEVGQEETAAVPAMKKARRRHGEHLDTKEKDAARIAEYCASCGIDPHAKLPYRFYEAFFPALYGPDYVAKNPQEFGKDGKNGRSKKTYWNRRINQWRQDTKSNGGQRLVINTKSKYARTRVSGKQGAPVKAAAIEEDLVLWLSQMRRKGVRVKPKLFLQKAKALRINFARISISKGQRAKVPQCDDFWSRRVRARHSISLRRPNVRWKVSHRVLCERQRITWSNVYRFRAAIRQIFGYEPEIWSFDQKPFHHDESGSKDQKTLDVVGAAEVPLRENHAETRKRWSATTFCVDRVERARKIPFGECLFSGGEKVSSDLAALLEELRASGHDYLQLRCNDTASYRVEHILDMLEDALEPWAPGRDWRILMCDAYRAHLDESVRRLAWQRGYIVIYQGGGTTGVGQVNDTDLHEFLSRDYMDLEQQCVIDQVLLDSQACPRRTREDCIRDFCTIYKNPDLHAFAARGFKRRGLSISLDGLEDGELRGTAAKIFHRVQMPALRDIIVSDMTKECEAGANVDGGGFTWSYGNVYGAMEDFPIRGQLDTLLDGQENEQPLAEDENDWSDREGVSDDEPEPENKVASAPVTRKALDDLRARHDWQDAERRLVAEGFRGLRVFPLDRRGGLFFVVISFKGFQ